MAICEKINTPRTKTTPKERKKTMRNSDGVRLDRSENNLQAAALVFCNSLLSYFIRKLYMAGRALN